MGSSGAGIKNFSSSRTRPFLRYLYAQGSELFLTLYRLLTQKRIEAILWSFLFINVLRVLLFTYYHIPHLSFDELNTLTIAQTSISDIWNILAYEQNFTFYYYLLFMAREIASIEVVAKTINFFTWILSLFLFYKLARVYIRNHTFLLYAIVLYSLIPSIYFYAYYVRMYGFMNVLGLIYLYSLIRFLSSRKSVWFYSVAFSVVALSITHFMAYVVIVVNSIISLLIVTDKKQKYYLLSVSVVGCFLIGIQLLLKFQPITTYLQDNAEYVHALKLDIITAPTVLFFVFYNYGPLFWLAFAYLIHRYFILFRTRGNGSMRKFPHGLLAVYAGVFLLTLVAYPSLLTRHAIVLIVPLLLCILLGLYSLRKNTVTYRGLSFFLLAFFLFKAFVFDSDQLLLELDHRVFCDEIRALDVDVVVAQYMMYLPLEYCIQSDMSGFNQVYTIDKSEGLVDMKLLTKKEISYYQARKGGSLDLPEYKEYRFYSFGYKQVSNDEISRVVRRLRVAVKTGETVAYVTRYETGAPHKMLLAEEVAAFQGYDLKQYLRPGIFIFKKRES